MFLARYVVQAVRVEGRPVREVAASYGISRAWVYALLARYDVEGNAAFTPRSRAPHRRAHKVPEAVEDQIVLLRKQLSEQGLDAGAHTIAFHLAERGGQVPSTSAIWRVLSRRGFITAQPQKRPRSSYVRFVADLPNECWQADTTHWQLADGTDIEVLNIVDDHSRLNIAAVARRTFKATDVVAAFSKAAAVHGLPASMLTDNGAIFTAGPRYGRTALEVTLLGLGIELKHSRPYHPQTCGKVERFHQTQKKWLAKQPTPASPAVLQRQLDRFRQIYNTTRPHRALGRRTPASAYQARAKAVPHHIPRPVDAHYRVRADKVYDNGAITLRHAGRLHHIGLGRAYAGQRVHIAAADLHIRISNLDGELIRELVLDPTRDYQPRPKT
jgi:transposase InsO family protein